MRKFIRNITFATLAGICAAVIATPDEVILNKFRKHYEVKAGKNLSLAERIVSRTDDNKADVSVWADENFFVSFTRDACIIKIIVKGYEKGAMIRREFGFYDKEKDGKVDSVYVEEIKEEGSTVKIDKTWFYNSVPFIFQKNYSDFIDMFNEGDILKIERRYFNLNRFSPYFDAYN